MPDVDGFAPGTPSWVDLASPDLDASAAFYGAMFGWQCSEAAEDDSAGGYRMFYMRDRAVAGMGPAQGGMPPFWTTYVSVDDADATVGQVKDAGGAVFMEPMDVLDVGRMAVLADSGGAAFAIWQPRRHKGAMIVREPGALTWNELASRDPDGAKAFYGTVFGWEPETAAMSDIEYTMFKLPGGESHVGGMLTMGETYPPEVPAHWMTYFHVAGCAASTAQAKDLGASVMVDCQTIDMGVFSTITDPQGAAVSLFQPTT